VVSLPSGTCSGITSNTAGITVNAVPVPSAQPTLSQSICIGGTIPTPLTISYSGGTGTPAYQWYSNTANSNVGGVLIAGATGSGYTPPVFTVLGSYYYYVVLTFSGSGCTSVTSDVATINVVNDPTIMAQPLTTQTVCQNVAATDLTVTATGGLGIYYYQWYSNTVNNTTSGTLIPAAIGASYKPSTTAVGTLYYYCVVTQTPGLGCNVTSSSAEVIVVPALSFKQQPVSNSVCLGGTPVNLFVDYQNGSGTPTYKWFSNTVDNTGTGTPISGTNSSTYIPSTATVGTTYYYCTITMSSGTCTSITSNTAIFTVTADPVIATQPTTTQNICVGGTIKTPLNVQHLGGTGNISYQWYSNTSNSKVGGTPILNATASSYTPPVFTTTGSYYYYVELDFSASGCDKLTSNTAEIVVLADPIVTAAPTPTQTVCQNSAPTDLTFTVSGGDGVFSYQWYNNADNNTTTGTLITSATNAIYTPSTSTAGKIYYYCKITQSSAGCDATTPTAEVIVEPQPIFTTQPISNTVCQNTMPAALSVTYSGGVGTPSYQWYSNTINSTSGTIIQGATNPTYSPPTGKTGSLYYYCTISLSKGGCSSLTSGTAQFIVNAIPKIGTLNTTICSGDPFLVTPNNLTGDTVPVGTTYIWSYPVISPAGSITGASVQSIPQTSISQTLTNSSGSLATATYTVTPISGTACTGTGFNVVVTVNPAINIAATVTDITCLGANNGSIQTVISSGVPFGSGNPYAILWSGPNGFTSTATTISGLLAGVYNLTVSDAVGCSVSKNYTIVEPKAIVITTDNEKNIPCFGANNGEIGITITGGTPPYNFVWTKNTAFYSNTEDLSDLGPGVYELTVTDKFNCAPKKATFTISEPSVLDVSLASQTNVLCYGQASGAIAVNVTGGTPFEKTPGVFSYNYMWLGPNGFTSSNQNLSNLAEGKYDLVVTDFLGCSKTLSVTVTQSTEIVDNITTTPITCYNANNATISLVISGGNAPYQINWSNGGSGTFQGNLAAGTYIITVTDNLGCQNISHVNIAEAPVYSISPKVTNISCHGAHDGVINLNLIGGKTPISVVWGDDPTTATVRTNLAPGTYTVTINDGTPCNINDSYNILEPGELVLSANLTNATDCNGVNSGAIDLLVAGGTAPYTYLWSTGDKTEDIKNVPAGIYSVLVKDANGCSTTAEYTLTRPLPIDISVNQLDGYDCSIQKTIKTCVATVKEGVPPYKLSWSRGTTSGLNNETMVTTESGLVDLQVVDALGCSKSFSFNVDILKLGIDYIVSDCNARKYEFNALVLDNQESYTYAWDFGDGITSDLKNPHHTFGKPGNFDLKLTVTSASCVAVYTETITVESRPVLALDREPLLCIGDSVVLHATGANFYRWSDGTVADSITIREKGNFSVIGRTLAGCLDTLNFSTSYYDSFNYTISTDRNEVFTDGTPLHIWSEAIPYSSYTWYFGDSISDATAGSDVYHTYEPKQAGHYDIKLKVINPNGCTETATKRVWITNNSIINTFSPNGDGVNDVFMKGWHLKIFNRNGIAIFEGSDGWDGTNNGKTVSSDTYFFIVYYETESGSKTRTGYVTVIQ
jgi:gliding motility-associated-like protein